VRLRLPCEQETAGSSCDAEATATLCPRAGWLRAWSW